MKQEIQILKNTSSHILTKLIRSSGSYASVERAYIDDVYLGKANLTIEKINWYFPFQAELFNVDEKEGVICFLGIGLFSSNNYEFKALIAGYVHYDSITEDEIKLDNSEAYSTINFVILKQFLNNKSLYQEYDDYVTRLNNQLKFSTQNSENDYLMEKIASIEDLEELDLVDEQTYISKIKMLQKIATGGRLKDEEIPRVWAEYSLVSQITSQPVLMNKAMAISLSKIQVKELLDKLNEKYNARIRRFKTDGKISLIFSPTLRGHQTSARNEIVLPKLGDWRFGYTDRYSAELIFHEFSHALDTPRTSKGSVRGKSDIHKHDFVRLLDMVLVDFSDFINEHYVPSNQREQILTNNDKLLVFYQNKDKIELELRKKENIEMEQKKSTQKDIYSSIGLSENSYPLTPLLSENEERKIEFLIWSLNQQIKEMNNKEVQLAKSIITKLQNKEYILTKPEILLLANTVTDVNKSKFVYNLPSMGEQLSASSYISKLGQQVVDLSKGKIEDLELKDDVRIRTYTEASQLKKTSGYED